MPDRRLLERLKAPPRFRRWWDGHRGFVGYCAVVLVAAANAIATGISIDDLQEKDDAIASVIGFSCNTNNAQDLLLGNLLVISLSSAQDRNLTDEEAVQVEYFRDAQKALAHPSKCDLAVERFYDGEPLPPPSLPPDPPSP